MASPLQGYTHQALPDLGSCLRNAPDSTDTVQLHVPTTNAYTRSLVRAAFAKILLLYIDIQDFLLMESESPNLHIPLRVQLSDSLTVESLIRSLESQHVSNASIDTTSACKQLEIRADQHPFPAVFGWGVELSPQASGSLFFNASVVDASDTLSMSLSFKRDVMSHASANNFIRQVKAAMDHFVAHPTSSVVAHIPFPADLSSQHAEHYDPARAELTPLWLMRNASCRPQAVAHEVFETVSAAPELLTYSELNASSNRLARWLVIHGVCSEDKIAVCRARDALFYTAHAAVFKSGGCYVPIDPELPEERKLFIAQDSGARFVLTAPGQATTFGALSVVMENVSLQSELAALNASNICFAQLDSLAYLLYTSGTTGTPKGCLLNHRGLFWAIDAMCTYPLPVTNADTDKRLALASIAFDVHISELCQSWRLGTRLVSGPRYEMLANLQQNIINIGITHLGMVPSMIEATLTSPDDLPLKYLVSGGEKISDALLQTWANHPKLILANFYGPTEATVGCTSRRIKVQDRKENIGRPFPSCRAYVVDANMNIVARGTPGELVVEGPLVGRGYHNLPEATAMVFKSWPRSDSRSYRTGDLVRMMPDNTLEIMGRIDTQIKLRGVRIESEGVSNVLKAASEDSQLDVSTIISTHPELGAEVLVSFVAQFPSRFSVIERRSAQPSITEMPNSLLCSLKDISTRRLAVYMRPSYIIPVLFLPLSLNGKTDNKVLASLFRATSVADLLHLQDTNDTASSSNVGARVSTTIEQHIIDMVSLLSGMPANTINPASNLFQCGLDSLKFTALAHQLRASFPARLSVGQIMVSPTIEAIARLANVQPAATSSDSTPTSQRTDRFDERWRAHASTMFNPDQIEAVLPLFPVQEGVLFRSSQSPEQYVQHFTYLCKTPVNLSQIRRSWDGVMERQQILRTVFVVDDHLLQVVLKHGANDLPWTEDDIATFAPASSFSEWFQVDQSRKIAYEINEDVTTPLFAVHVYRHDGDTFIVFSINHALYDGNAMPLLIQDFENVYQRRQVSTPVLLSEVLNYIPSGEDTGSQNFWRKRFDDLSPRSLRTPTTATTKLHSRSLEASLGDVQARCNSHCVSIQAALTLAFAFAARGILGWQNDAVFGVVRSGRSLAFNRTFEAICPLVSVVPTRVNLDERSVHTLLQMIQKDINDAIPFEHTPLGRIQRLLGVKELIDVLFSCRTATSRLPSTIIEHIPSHPAQAEFVLAVEVVMHPMADTIEVRLAHTETDVPVSDIAVFMDRFNAFVEGLLEKKANIDDVFPADATDLRKHQSLNVPNGIVALPDSLNADMESLLIEHITSFMHIESTLLSPNRSFTSVGLNSLMAVALSRHLADQGMAVTPVAIIQADSIRELSNRMNSDRSSTPTHRATESWLQDMERAFSEELDLDSLKLDTQDRLEVVGCTALQSGMLSQTINSDGELYVHAFTFQLDVTCDVEQLRVAWQRAIQHIGILRTSFHFAPTMGRWAQVLHSRTHLEWSHEERPEISGAAVDFIASLSFKDEMAFSRPPFYLRHVFAEQDYLVIVLHHALYDGISLPKLFSHVHHFYHQTPIVPAVRFDHLAKSILAQEKAGTSYWIDLLKDVQPWFFPRAGTASDHAWRSWSTITVPLADIQRTCRRYQISPQTLGQAAWAKVLALTSNAVDVVFGQVISGRVLADAEDVIGPVFNTIPCRVTLKRRQLNKELLRAVHRWNVNGIAWQHASLRSIQRELNLPALCDTLFLFQPAVQATESVKLWKMVTRSEQEESKTQYSVNIELHEQDSKYKVYASCAADAMSRSQLTELLGRFHSALSDLVLFPNAPVLPDMFFTPNATTRATRVQSAHEHTSVKYGTWSEEQRLLHDILGRFTKLPAASITPSTYLAAIGVDSISSIQIAGIAKRAGLPVIASDVARSSTVNDLMSVLSRKGDGSISPTEDALELSHQIADVVPLRSLAIPPELQKKVVSVKPVSAGQEWTIARWILSGGLDYRHTFVYKIKGEHDASTLKATWNMLIKKHSILRSTFLRTFEDDYRWAMCTFSSYDPIWIESVLDHGLDEAEEVRLHARRLLSLFLPSTTPFTRLALLYGATDHYMVVGLHHFQYDGWSLRLLMQDFESMYCGQPSAVTHNSDHFLRFYRRDDAILDEQRTYWQTTLSTDFSWMGLTAQNPSIALSEPKVHNFHGLVDIDGLPDRANAHGISLSSILLASWAMVQANVSSSQAATFAVALHNRSSIPEIENLATNCYNVLPVHVNTATTTVLDIARTLQSELQTRSVVVQQTRLVDLCAWVGNRGSRIFNVYVNLIQTTNGHRSPSSYALLEPFKLRYAPQTQQKDPSIFGGELAMREFAYDVMVEIRYPSHGGSVTMVVECDEHIMDEVQVASLVKTWADVLRTGLQCEVTVTP